MSTPQSQPDATQSSDGSAFTEPSEEVKQRNRVTGFIFLAVVLGMIALAMIVRAYGG